MNREYCKKEFRGKLQDILIEVSKWVIEIETKYEFEFSSYFQIDNIFSEYDKKFDVWDIYVYYSFDVENKNDN